MPDCLYRSDPGVLLKLLTQAGHCDPQHPEELNLASSFELVKLRHINASQFYSEM